MRSSSSHLRLAVVLARELDLVDLDELLPLLELLVDRLEDARGLELVRVVAEALLQRLARALVRRVEVEDVAVALDGAGDVGEVRSRGPGRAGT